MLILSHFFDAKRCTTTAAEPKGSKYERSHYPTMSPPPSKGSKGKWIYARRCRICRIVVAHTFSPSIFEQQCSRNVSCAARDTPELTRHCLACLSLSNSCSHHLRLGRYHLPLVVRRSVQGRYLFGSASSRKSILLSPRLHRPSLKSCLFDRLGRDIEIFSVHFYEWRACDASFQFKNFVVNRRMSPAGMMERNK